MTGRYADVIIDISHEKVDRVFQYKIPETLLGQINIGTPVSIPFGRGNKLRQGYVVGISDKASFDETKLKEIDSVPKKSLSIESELIELAGWMKNYYGSTMIAALKTVTPVKEKVKKRESTVPRISEQGKTISEIFLNDEQSAIVEDFSRDFEDGKRNCYLLHGITGSGKTEVYIELVREVVREGKSAIVLIPEIALTLQTVTRFEAAFGNRISIINSRLSKGEKYEEFKRAENGETDLIIGPRSALFAPFDNLGLIIIDEEHDNAYKSETTPKYHARETALERARLAGASVVLGSATPSVESYFRAENHEYKLWKMKNRAIGDLAEVSIVDLREELKRGNRSIISGELYDKMDKAFKAGEQVMLFINRRGFNSFVSCRSCGKAIKCPKCDVSMALHNGRRLICHYCGHEEEMPQQCPQCKSKLIGGYGTGTEKVEAAVKDLFPDIKTLRMDKDTTGRKDDHARIISAFRDHKADCLIGTQMIVKGHDFENVTVVGIILADLSLFDSDYEAAERTFDLLTQAAGRAGRRDKKGEVVIQTYQPEHYAITAAASQDYEGFYKYEMAYRKLLKFPPAAHMLGMLFISKDENMAKKAAEDIALVARRILADSDTAIITGPGPAFIGRINENYRIVLYAREEKYDKLIELIGEADKIFNERYPGEEIELQFDMDPMGVI
ncbi:replication restart DNA helicase PriA [Eubacterium ruminantium]|nr:replication restart DNA helicase PriA [Eubacterium ruminantium]